MPNSIRYYITDANGNMIDWANRTGVSFLDIFGKQAQVFGSGEADAVYVQAGTSADLTELSGGNDRIYLSGALADYSQEKPRWFKSPPLATTMCCILPMGTLR
jgi:hypothetical protein